MQSFLSCQDTLLRTPPGPPAEVLAEGTVLAGRFELRRFIARGGMGVVYEAEDRMLRARVAVKVLLGAVPDARERIRREVLLARAVAHPNVCRVYELFAHPCELGQLLFLVMELLDGETLTAALSRRGRFRPDEAEPLLRQMAAALAAAHASWRAPPRLQEQQRPPRPPAGRRHPRRGHRLRRRPRRARGTAVAHLHRQLRRHARVHGSGAGRGLAARPGRRRLRAGGRRLRDAHRRASLRRHPGGPRRRARAQHAARPHPAHPRGSGPLAKGAGPRARSLRRGALPHPRGLHPAPRRRARPHSGPPPHPPRPRARRGMPRRAHPRWRRRGRGSRSSPRRPTHRLASPSSWAPEEPIAARAWRSAQQRLDAADNMGAAAELRQVTALAPDFVLARSELAQALDRAGFSAEARDTARFAFESAGRLPEQQRMAVEAQYRALSGEQERAAGLWGTLFDSSPATSASGRGWPRSRPATPGRPPWSASSGSPPRRWRPRWSTG